MEQEPEKKTRMRAIILLTAWLALTIIATSASAQVPTATGRSFTLSNAAWKVFIPSTYVARPGNVSDVLVHFHGDPQTYWNNAKYADLNAVLVTVNYSGLSSAYTTPFSNQALFQQVVDEALTKVRQQADIPDTLQWDKLAVSSFSAGYGAVREILKNATYRNEIDALLAADSLYATTAGDGTSVDSQLADYKTFANLAKNGSKTFLYSHSQVPTYTYESTFEVGDELMQSLGIAPSAYNVNGLGTLNFYRTAQTGNFRLWGALGSDGDSHLEHLRYIGEFLKQLPLAKATVVAPPIAGDFNSDGVVDASDYVFLRNAATNRADYGVWRTNFGATSASSASLVATSLVPEPTAVALLVLACAGAWPRRFKR